MKDVSVQQAVEMLADVCGVAGLVPEAGFGELDLDSLALIEWVSMLEEGLEAELDIRDLDMQELGGLSVGGVVEALRRRVAGG